MFQEDKWPFLATRLSEIIDAERLAVIQAGSSARLGRAITILDYDPARDRFFERIESLGNEHGWDPFCALLRDERQVMGGNDACRECDLRQAPDSLALFRKEDKPFREFNCHMGLRDATHVIVVRGRPVALLYTGQYRPPEGVIGIQERVNALGEGEWQHIRLAESVRNELRARAQRLPDAPADFEAKLRLEAQHIERLAEAEYSGVKYQWEQSFLDRLRRSSPATGAANLESIRDTVQAMLDQVRAFCRADYAIFFASTRMNDMVLMPIGWAGVPPAVSRHLPHFNWKKAGFPSGIDDPAQPAARQTGAVAGIRGDNSEFFVHAVAIKPATLGVQYRGVLALGPCTEFTHAPDEQHFLEDIATVIGARVLTELEVRYLEQESKRWESTVSLLTHQLRTALTPITTQIGRAKAMAGKLSGDETAHRLTELLSRTEDLSIRLAEGSRQTVAGHVLQVERSDMEFERYPLSVLVGNVAEGFAPRAELHRRQLQVERSVELLPDADIDVARFTIVLSNLLDNAIKYSYPNTVIKVRGAWDPLQDPRSASAVIEVDDLGDEVREEERREIFEQGTRGLTAVKLGRIPGTGLGLWEARAVIEAHGGEIGLTCEPTKIQRNPGAAFHVVFSVRIPLYQKESKGRAG